MANSNYAQDRLRQPRNAGGNLTADTPAHKAAVAKLQSLMDAGDPKPGIDNTRMN